MPESPLDRQLDALPDIAAKLDEPAAIGRLADDLLPALIVKLAASGLGELEVRQAAWRVRLRMPAVRQPAERQPERRGSGHVRAQPGLGGHAHLPSGADPRRAGEESSPGSASPDAASLTAVGPGRPGDGLASAAQRDRRRHRAVATSPAVGFFEPRKDVSSGRRVREGDRLGTVDVLGIRQDVLAPVDGVVGASLVESGEAVEYGQELLWIELTTDASAGMVARDVAQASIEATGQGPAEAAGQVPTQAPAQVLGHLSAQAPAQVPASAAEQVSAGTGEAG